MSSPLTCSFCGFTTKNRATMSGMTNGAIRCKSGNACMRRLRSGTHLRRRVRLTLAPGAPTVMDPPLESADRKRADRHERYRHGKCVDCGMRPYSPGRPRCTPCHEKMVAFRALGFGDG